MTHSFDARDPGPRISFEEPELIARQVVQLQKEFPGQPRDVVRRALVRARNISEASVFHR